MSGCSVSSQELRLCRCMWASNYPVDKHAGVLPADLYAGFDRVIAHLPADQQQQIYAGTARTVYRL